MAGMASQHVSPGAYPGAPSLTQAAHGSGFQSWYSTKGDDLGKPIVLHKPLNKGVYTQSSLAKSFAASDPSQAPSVLIPKDVHGRPMLCMSTSDIPGAKSTPKDVQNKPRGTNPLTPVYTLPGHSTTAATGAGAVACTAAVTNPLRVDDIEGAAPKPWSGNQPQKRDHCLNISDIAGSNAGWQPQHRGLANNQPTDQRFNTSDINTRRTRVPEPKSRGDPWYWGTGTVHESSLQARARARPASAAPQGLTVAMPYTGLPYFQMERPRSGLARADSDPREICEQHTQSAAGSAAGGDVSALVQQQTRDMAAVNATMAIAKRQGQLLRMDIAHALRVSVGEAARAARQAADSAVRTLQVPREAVTTLWESLKASDREASGKVTVPEFSRALQQAGIQLSEPSLTAIVSGLRDGVGLLPYQDLTRTLLAHSKHRSMRPHSAQPCMQASALAHVASSQVLKPSQPSPVATLQPSQLPASTSGRHIHNTEQSTTQEPHTLAQQGQQQQQLHTLVAEQPQPTRSAPSNQQCYVARWHGLGTAQDAVTPQQDQSHDPAHGKLADAQQQAPAPARTPCAQQQQVSAQVPGMQASTGEAPATVSAAVPLSPVTEAHAATLTSAAAGQKLSQKAVLQGPEGAQYCTVKGKTYWFSGCATAADQAVASAAYKPCKDMTHDVVLKHMRLGLGSGEPLPPTLSGLGSGTWTGMPTSSTKVPAGASYATSPAVAHCPPGPSFTNLPTTSHLLKTGKISADQLESQLLTKHMHRGLGAAAGQRPHSAGQDWLLPATCGGGSVGSTLHASMQPHHHPTQQHKVHAAQPDGQRSTPQQMGQVAPYTNSLTGAPAVWAQSSGTRSRPSSSRPGGGSARQLATAAPAPAPINSFTATANTTGSSLLSRHSAALQLQHDIAMVRSLG